MKKLIILSLVMAVLFAVSFFIPVHAQDSAKEEKPTFYRLIPGTYVNDWPRFTMTYPKHWVEERPGFGEAFRAVAPGEGRFAVSIFPSPLPLEKFANLLVSFRNVAQDVTFVSDKPSQLRDGTPAREVEIKMVINREPRNLLFVATKKGDTWIQTWVGSGPSGKKGEDQRAILYSLEFQPEKDEPVKVPPDVQEFLDKFCSNVVSHDVAKVMTHFSDRFLDSGWKKGESERFHKQIVGLVQSFEAAFTEFIPAGDRAYVAGFAIINGIKGRLGGTSIVKENGEWKFFGNQRDVSP